MLTEKQLEILKVFRKNLLRKMSFTNLKKELKEPSSSKLQRALKKFGEEEIIASEKIGKNILISLNLENNKLFDYLSLYDFESRKMPFDILYNIQKEILKETEFFSLIVFGSYALGTATKKSDLDVAIIVENDNIKKKIIPRINSVKRKEIVEIHFEVILRKEFLEMLRVEEENLGKEIARNYFVFYGGINFYKLILKEMKNAGFN